MDRKSLQSKEKSALISTGKAPVIDLKTERDKRSFPFLSKRLLYPLAALLLAFAILLVYTEKKITPILIPLADKVAEEYVTETVNRCVGELAKAGLISYEKMVKVRFDTKGQVVFLEVDTEALSLAKSRLVKAVDDSLSAEKKIKISLPLGSLTRWATVSGRGIPVSVRVYSEGIAEGEIFTVLEDCGINQTRHLIQIKIRAELFFVLPGEVREVTTQVILPLGERILVGDVPEIYLDNIGAS